MNGDELEASYTDVIMSRRSLAQTARIQAALASFDRYVRARVLPELPTVSLPGFGGAAYAISSRILVEREYRAGLRMIGDGTLTLSDTSAAALRAFWILAYRFGLRRTEILGLQRRDIDTLRLQVRINEARHLKTRNARRVLPMQALIPEEQRAVHALMTANQPEAYLFFDHRPSASELDGHPVIAHAKALLQRVTGDPHVHAHNLRHSTATLYLLGILGSDLQIALHPYTRGARWITDAIAQANRVDHELSGALHRKAGRGNAIAMMMGHGSELTTYEHYTHCFDLLLFLACWRGKFRSSRQPPWQRLFPPRQEAAQLRAMLGVAPTSGVQTTDIEALFRHIAGLRPGGTTLLEPLDAPADATAPGHRDSQAPCTTLAELLALPEATGGQGYLTKQSDRDTVAALLDQFNRALATHGDRLTDLLDQWARRKRAHSDWSAMSAEQARQWTKGFRAVLPDVQLEAFHTGKSAGGKTVKSAVAPIREPRALRATHGQYCIRIADPRPKLTRHHSRSGRQRSRSQRSITWLLLTLAGRTTLTPDEKGKA